MKQPITFLGAMTLGAGAMYILDPNRGRSRRAYLRDRTFHAMRKTSKDAVMATHDLRHRAKGLLAEAKAKMMHPEVSDDILIERIRSRLGHLISFPKEIQVSIHQGQVVLSGQVLQRELDHLFHEIKSIIGNREIISELKAFETPKAHAKRLNSNLFPESPGVRLLIGTLAGGALSLFLARKNAA